jgi:hypothetical protein
VTGVTLRLDRMVDLPAETVEGTRAGKPGKQKGLVSRRGPVSGCVSGCLRLRFQVVVSGCSKLGYRAVHLDDGDIIHQNAGPRARRYTPVLVRMSASLR